MNRVLEYVIRAKDKTSSAISSARMRITSFAKAVATQLVNIKAGFDMAFGAVSKIASAFSSAIGEAFKFEKAVANFKTLLGSVDAAKAHLEDLRTFAASTPLTFPDLQEASKLMLSFGASVDSIMPSLKMLGDISMGDRQKFQGLALVFAQVRAAGRLMGQDLLQMINQGFNPLTIISQKTGKSIVELKGMMEDGAISFEMVEAAMRAATSEGGLFCGAMEEASKTGEGMISTLQDNWTDAVRTFGQAFADAAKGGVGSLNDALVKLKEDGTIEEWAKESMKWIEYLKDGVLGIGKAIDFAYKYSGAKDVWNYFQGTVAGIGNAIGKASGTLKGGGGIGDTLKAIGEGFKEGLGDELGEDGFYWKALGNPQPLEEAVKKVKDAKAELKKDEGGGQGGIGAQGGKTIEELFNDNGEAEKFAETIADKRDEIEMEHYRALMDWQNEQTSQALAEKVSMLEDYYDAVADCQNEDELKELQKLRKVQERKIDFLRDIENEERRQAEKRQQEQEKLAEKRQRQLEKEQRIAERAAEKQYELALKNQENAERRVKAAQEAVEQAWGWYKDPESLKAKIADEEKNIEANKKYRKDYYSLTHGRWSDEFKEAVRLQRKGETDKLEERMAKWRKGSFGLSVEKEATMRVALAKEAEKDAQRSLEELVSQSEEQNEHLKRIAESLTGEKEDA